jgi:hypothetical protein
MFCELDRFTQNPPTHAKPGHELFFRSKERTHWPPSTNDLGFQGCSDLLSQFGITSTWDWTPCHPCKGWLPFLPTALGTLGHADDRRRPTADRKPKLGWSRSQLTVSSTMVPGP